MRGANTRTAPSQDPSDSVFTLRQPMIASPMLTETWIFTCGEVCNRTCTSPPVTDAPSEGSRSSMARGDGGGERRGSSSSASRGASDATARSSAG